MLRFVPEPGPAYIVWEPNAPESVAVSIEGRMGAFLCWAGSGDARSASGRGANSARTPTMRHCGWEGPAGDTLSSRTLTTTVTSREGSTKTRSAYVQNKADQHEHTTSQCHTFHTSRFGRPILLAGSSSSSKSLLWSSLVDKSNVPSYCQTSSASKKYQQLRWDTRPTRLVEVYLLLCSCTRTSFGRAPMQTVWIEYTDPTAQIWHTPGLEHSPCEPTTAITHSPTSTCGVVEDGVVLRWRGQLTSTGPRQHMREGDAKGTSSTAPQLVSATGSTCQSS